MEKVMLTLEETAALINSGRHLALAATEELLRALPRGNWIGGTIPYFVGEKGGLESTQLIHATELADAPCPARILDYTSATLPRVALDAPENGFTVLIIPAASALHREYAAQAQDYEDMFLKPIVGWISGVHLKDLGRVSPKVINGTTGQLTDSGAVAIHVPLPPGTQAIVRIINLFRQGEGDVLTFPQDGFTVTECRVNGQTTNFAQYLKERDLDLSRPLVADYNGARINTSFQSVDPEKGQVHLYAPVFAGIEYKHAAPTGDYVQEFNTRVAGLRVAPRFACNCILNYIHGKLEGRRTGTLTGPVTFGEIGYQLLNQTLVYLEMVAS